MKGMQRGKPVNMQMKRGVRVKVMNPDDRNYLKVGEIVKMRGTKITVRFGYFNHETYPAMYLQTVK